MKKIIALLLIITTLGVILCSCGVAGTTETKKDIETARSEMYNDYTEIYFKRVTGDLNLESYYMYVSLASNSDQYSKKTYEEKAKTYFDESVSYWDVLMKTIEKMHDLYNDYPEYFVAQKEGIEKLSSIHDVSMTNAKQAKKTEDQAKVIDKFFDDISSWYDTYKDVFSSLDK